jgi:hypothetical protein
LYDAHEDRPDAEGEDEDGDMGITIPSSQKSMTAVTPV